MLFYDIVEAENLIHSSIVDSDTRKFVTPTISVNSWCLQHPQPAAGGQQLQRRWAHHQPAAAHYLQLHIIQ